MKADELYVSIASFVVGVLFLAFPRAIGVGFCRIGKAVWKGHEGHYFGQDSVQRVYDETKAPGRFRFLGIIFLIQAVVVFVLSSLR
jgi:hypothetical protein